MSEFSVIIQWILVLFLIASAIGVSVTRNLFMAVIVFMGYSSVMAIVWLFLESPDLAITEAAVGAGIDTVLFFLTLKKVHALKGTREG
nr:hydrogenase subunit MbhD domain-containing protein [uncultured Anaerotignum sp.]